MTSDQSPIPKRAQFRYKPVFLVVIGLCIFSIYYFISRPVPRSHSLDNLSGRYPIPMKANDSIQAVSLAPEGLFLLLGTASGELWKLDLVTRQYSRLTFSPHNVFSGRILAISISQSSSQALVGYGYDKLCVVDLRTRKVISQWDNQDGFIQAVLLLDDGRAIVGSSGDRLVQIWDFREKRLLQSIQCREVPGSLVMLQKRNQLAASSFSEVKLWDLSTSTVRKSFSASHIRLERIVLMSGNRLVGADGLGMIYVWNLQTGQLVQEFGSSHFATRTFAISLDEKYCLLGGLSAPELWDVRSGTFLDTVETNRGLAFVCFHPNNLHYIIIEQFDDVVIGKLPKASQRRLDSPLR